MCFALMEILHDIAHLLSENRLLDYQHCLSKIVGLLHQSPNTYIRSFQLLNSNHKLSVSPYIRNSLKRTISQLSKGLLLTQIPRECYFDLSCLFAETSPQHSTANCSMVL
jgi:hypothetical protein